MSLRRNRVHHCGASNIDYRSKNDTESLKLFQPWNEPKNFGSMGCIDYHLPSEKLNELFDVSKELNTLKDRRNESPDPKVYHSSKFYKLKKIFLNQRNMNVNEKVAELDESIKGKDKYVGDSMMYSDSLKFRLDKKQKLINALSQKDIGHMGKQALQKPKIAIKPARAESISKVNDGETDGRGLKLKEIRNDLRRRYESKNNIRKVFKDWDSSLTGEVSVYDVHQMLNRMNINVNHSLAKALIDYSNRRNTNTLNLEEFIHLIYSDESVATMQKQMSPKKFTMNNEKELIKGSALSRQTAKMRSNIIEANKTLEYIYLKKHLQTKTNTLLKNITEIEGGGDEVNDGSCDLSTFTKALKKMPLKESYLTESIIKAIYDEYIDGDSQRMNYKKLIDDCINSKDKRRAFDLSQHGTINLFNEKISTIAEKLQLDSPLVKKEEGNKRSLCEDLKRQIDQKQLYHQRSYSTLNEVNSSQPSLEFINKVFGNRKTIFLRHKEIEESFTPLPSVISTLSPKTRFNGNPPIKNTAVNVQGDEKSFMYQNETDRFNLKERRAIDLVNYQKKLKFCQRNKKWERIEKNMTKAQSSCNIRMKLNEQKELIAQLFHTKRQYEYESRNQIRNDIFSE